MDNSVPIDKSRYVRPKQTITEQLNEIIHKGGDGSQKLLNEKLKGYVTVSQEELPYLDYHRNHVHLRYVVKDLESQNEMLRLGGFLAKVHKDYVVLTNRQVRWSVQLKNNPTFFRKLSHAELLQKELSKTVSEKEKLEEQISILKAKEEFVLGKMVEKINLLEQENEFLKQKHSNSNTS